MKISNGTISAKRFAFICAVGASPFGNFIGHNLENQNGRRYWSHRDHNRRPKGDSSILILQGLALLN